MADTGCDGIILTNKFAVQNEVGVFFELSRSRVESREDDIDV